ncbi:aminodeoxychorismate synthase component I [Bradyrhizobium australiense]|uniref:aminodeoxychorismate synthase n=1 Tax=Bradyrhizobium australiense TaxID=2721161 RepID=A0A7Y4LWM1_9BRAD|nr:aminodeoxychorismate synthase component I [Bradyrhizobium australiense]NOJ41578.1 aminodeoxychorismate synthase component I [Bradyrhizobium australiense]
MTEDVSHLRDFLFETVTYVARSSTISCRVSAEDVFVRLFGGTQPAFWLDSSRLVSGLSRWSFMGELGGSRSYLASYDASRQEIRIARDDRGSPTTVSRSIFDLLANNHAAHKLRDPGDVPDIPFKGGHVGYFGYELKSLTCGVSSPPSKYPDACFIFCTRFLAFDHENDRIHIVALYPEAEAVSEEAALWVSKTQRDIERIEPAPSVTPSSPANSAPLQFKLRQRRARYLENIERCLSEIRAGETYEVCLTNEITVETGIDPLGLYRILRRRNPAPYSAFLRLGNICVASSSPERFLRIHSNLIVETKPIKGTAARHAIPEEDERIAEELRLDEKSRAENLMIVDLMRNDLGRICRTGSVHVPSLMHIESYKTVHQLVSIIRGELASPDDIIPCISVCFPGGSITGAPKIRTLKIIDELEQAPRGVYTGAIGYLSLCGEVDLNIVIRTIVCQGRHLSIGCGGAIVALSNPNAEFDEILLKAREPIRAIAEAVTGDPDHALVIHGADNDASEEIVPNSAHRVRLARFQDRDTIAKCVQALLTELGGPGPQFELQAAVGIAGQMAMDSRLGFALIMENVPAAEVIGIAVVSQVSAVRASGHYGVLQELWVDPRYRSAQHGRWLLAAVDREARARGWPMIEVSLPLAGRPGAERLVAFYESMGFTPAGQRRRRLL